MARRKLTEAEAKKAKRGKCIVKFCRKDREVNGAGAYYLCRRCREREQVKTHPWISRYRNLKVGAARRKIPFTLTMAEFKEFCRRTELIERKLTVDRVDPCEGYSIDNIRPLTLHENCSLGGKLGSEMRHNHVEKKIAQHNLNRAVEQHAAETYGEDDNCPF